jgi:poly(hydroxyalkanoate) granule associated protein phasin
MQPKARADRERLIEGEPMSNTIRASIPLAGAAVLAAPRQIWLVTLGAAAVTRGWAHKEAGTVFRTLVKEGSAVESQAMRVVGSHVDTSVKRANALARQARAGLRSSVDALSAVASTLVRRRMPTLHARFDAEAAKPPRQRAAKAAKRAVTTRRTPKSRTQK